MRDARIRKASRQIKLWLALLLGLGVLGGCQTQEAPLSPGGAAFKKEVRQAIDMINAAAGKPVAEADVTAAKEALHKIMPESLKLCRACPFMLALLNSDGMLVTLYPPQKKNASKRYSEYKLVLQALKDGKICHGRLFLRDRSRLYAICAPLTHNGKIVGVMVLTTTEDEVQKRWGISEEEFFAIDFNR